MKASILAIAAIGVLAVVILLWGAMESRGPAAARNHEVDHDAQAIPSSRARTEASPDADSSMLPSNAETPPVESRKSVPDIKDLGRKLLQGDAAARAELMAIALDTNTNTAVRRASVLVLSNDKDRDVLMTFFDLLSDADRSIRSAALFALPQAKRPTDYDYTSEPTAESSLQLSREKERLLNAP